MNGKIGLLAATAIGMGALTAASGASAQAYGSAALNTYRDCSTAGAGQCGGDGAAQRIVAQVLSGGVSSTANSSLVLSGQTVTVPGIGGGMVTVPNDGSYATSAVSFGAFDLPVIRGATSAGSTERMNINAFGYQTYTYNGDPGSSTPFSITGDLHIVSFSGNDVTDVSPVDRGSLYAGGAGGTAYVGVWDTAVLSSFTDAQSIFNNLFLAQCGSSSHILAQGFTNMTLNGTGGDTVISATTNACNSDGSQGVGPLTLMAGQTVLVVAGIQLPVNRGGMVDATHTFVTSFTQDAGVDVENLASGESFIGPPGGVPEPAAWAMMLLGFFGLGSALRRRQVRLAV